MIGYIMTFLAGVAVIPLIEEMKHQHYLHTQRKEAKLEALVAERINARELASWGIICSTPSCNQVDHGHA